MILLLAAIAVLMWVRMSRRPWSAIGLGRPRSSPTTVAIGIVSGVVFKIVMKALVMPLLGAPPVNQAFTWLTGNTPALIEFILMVMVTAGFAEEVLFRGFLFDRLGSWLGTGRWATVATVVITAALFGAVHWQGQKLPGVQQAVIAGLVFGALYARTRNLWMIMIAHTAFDLTAAWMIYYGLETRFSQFFFR
jgi:membrane protease YdiL (CAAX protease family)